MATALDWNLLSPLVQLAARPIGQSALRYEVRDATDDVRIYFGSGWYADVAFDLVASLDSDNLPSIKRLSAELYAQYEKHGMPIALRGEVDRRVEECMEQYDDAVIDRLVAKVQQYGGKPDSFKIREDGTFVAQGPIRFERIPEPAHTCPGCGSSCDPPINVWGANIYGCAKCCPSIGSYSSRIVIKYPDDAWRADVDCAPIVDGLTEAECLRRFARQQHHADLMSAPTASMRLNAAQKETARVAWSSRLRELQVEARRKEREQVTIDTSMWDD